MQIALLVDFGVPNPINDQGAFLLAREGTPVEPSTLASGPRPITGINLNPQQGVPVGCHSVTLVATHAFQKVDGSFFCPQNPADVSRLSWLINVCAADVECPVEACPEATQFCGDLGEGGAGGGS